MDWLGNPWSNFFEHCCSSSLLGFRLQLMRIVRKLSGRFKLLHVNVVRTTNNLPCILVVEKLPVDEIRDSIKGQLAHLNQYVNVSPEIYKCIHTEDVDDDFDGNKAS